MDELEKNPRGGAGTEPPKERLEREKHAAADALSKAGSNAGRVGADLGNEAAAAAGKVRDGASSSLSDLARSVRRASEDYGRDQPGFLADLMNQAADGVDSMAKAVGDQSPSAMLGTARDFGRRNPFGLLLGGAAVGFAISRIATSAAASAPAGSDPARAGESPRGDASEGGSSDGA